MSWGCPVIVNMISQKHFVTAIIIEDELIRFLTIAQLLI